MILGATILLPRRKGYGEAVERSQVIAADNLEIAWIVRRLVPPADNPGGRIFPLFLFKECLAMGDEQTPSVEEIKSRLKAEIPVEEETTKATGQADVAAELKRLGRQFAETLQTAWNSEERLRMEHEVRQGIRSFAGEVDKVIQEARKSQAADRVKEEAAQVKERVEAAELGRKARAGVAQGLQWLSEELGRLAEQFTPPAEAAEKTDSEEVA
jgi:predicted NAD-dependent protein-ADP-ribosyltransferase YbiA (DUF1768 family)